VFLAQNQGSSPAAPTRRHSDWARWRWRPSVRGIMKYMETEKVIQVGDNVLYHGAPGVIVFVIDDARYCDRYPEEHWSYLGKGLGVELQDDTRTLYHLDSPDEDLEPIPPGRTGGG
jgi:hypothetical protein